MADFLKITTPLVPKNSNIPNKPVTDPTLIADMVDLSKVVKTSADSKMHSQNNTLMQGEDKAPSVLMNLLKDPSVTVNFLKNIFLLQEIIKLLPINNSTITEEIQQLFDSLLIQPQDIVGEIISQENSSTIFKGELFDFLRLLSNESAQPELKYAITNLLKSINQLLTQRDVLDSVSNNLTFLADSLSASGKLSNKLYNLANAFKLENAAELFKDLKDQALNLIEEVAQSILLTPKVEKTLPIVIYNLSRFNDNPDYLGESINNLLLNVDGKHAKDYLTSLIKEYLSTFMDSSKQESVKDSKVMNVISEIIGKETQEASITLLNSEKIEKIIHSLLSSPCNFTPLLHFVIPVEYMEMKSFAEFWVDPNADGEGSVNQDGTAENVHMLVVFDIEGVGTFEAELFVKQHNINLSLLCPPAYAKQFAGLKNIIPRIVADSIYRFDNITIEKLERSRSLMDVFKGLPHKRTGVDVKV